MLRMRAHLNIRARGRPVLMSACPNCGAIPRPNDRFCNTCGRPVAAQPAQAPPAYGAPPQPAPPAPQGYGPSASPAAPQPLPPWGAQPAGPPRCQLGHEIAPGQNYCSQGHPIALEGVQFAGNPQPYGAQAASPYPGRGGAPQPPPYAFAPAPQQGYAPAPPPQQPYPPGPPVPPPHGPSPQGYAPPAPAYAPPQPAPLPAFKPPPQASDEPNLAAAAPAGRTLRGFLVSFQVNQLGDFWPLYSGRLTIGRANSGESLDVPLADATISSRHAALTVEVSGGIQLEDTGSTNGTFVNDEHLGF